jgi:hypothetical protein
VYRVYLTGPDSSPAHPRISDVSKCFKRGYNQIHVLNLLAEQLETAIGLVATVDTDVLVRHEFAASMLREVEDLLAHTHELILEQAVVIRESNPQTSGPL